MFLFANNASSTLVTAIGVADTELEIVSGDGSKFPDPADYEKFAVTLKHPESGEIEIMHCTERMYGDTLIVERAQEGTIALSFPVNTIVAHQLTAEALEYIRDN